MCATRLLASMQETWGAYSTRKADGLVFGLGEKIRRKKGRSRQMMF